MLAAPIDACRGDLEPARHRPARRAAGLRSVPLAVALLWSALVTGGCGARPEAGPAQGPWASAARALDGALGAAPTVWAEPDGAWAVAVVVPARLASAVAEPLAALAAAFNLDAQAAWSLRLRSAPAAPVARATEDLGRLWAAPPDGGVEAWLALNPLPAAWLHLRIVAPSLAGTDPEAEPAAGSLGDHLGTVQTVAPATESAEMLALAADTEASQVAGLRALGAEARVHRLFAFDRPVLLVARRRGAVRVLDLVVDLQLGPDGLPQALAVLPPVPARLSAPAEPGPWAALGRLGDAELAAALDAWGQVQRARAALEGGTPEPPRLAEAQPAPASTSDAQSGPGPGAGATGVVGWALARHGDGHRLVVRGPGPGARAPAGEVTASSTARWGPSVPEPGRGAALAWGGPAATPSAAAVVDPALQALWAQLAALADCGWPCAPALWRALPAAFEALPSPGVVALRWPGLTPAGPVAVVGDAQEPALARFSARPERGPVAQAALTWRREAEAPLLVLDLRWRPPAGAAPVPVPTRGAPAPGSAAPEGP